MDKIAMEFSKEDIEFLRVACLLYFFCSLSVGDEAGTDRVVAFAKKLRAYGYE